MHDAFMRELDATRLAARAYHPAPQGARHETRKRHPSPPKAARDQGNTAARDVGVLVHPGIFARLVCLRRKNIVGITFANAVFSVISQHAAEFAL